MKTTPTARLPVIRFRPPCYASCGDEIAGWAFRWVDGVPVRLPACKQHAWPPALWPAAFSPRG
jgi:hypothetical protein